MIKKFVLDTSIIVTDPKCLENFPNAEIIIQIGVLTELDKIKKYSSEIGRNARLFIRTLDELSENADLCAGIQLADNSRLLISSEEAIRPDLGDPTYVDNRILTCAIELKSKNPDDKIIVVSKDINLRVRARASGLDSQDYSNKKTTTNEFYSGVKRIQNEKLGAELINNKYVVCDDYLNSELMPNECVCFTSKDGRVMSLGRAYGGEVRYVNGYKPWGLGTRSVEQAFAVDMLLDPKVPLISLVGTAGTGKTLLSVACALDAVITKKDYNRFIVYRPMQPVGAEMGFLPGDMEEKLDPWMAAIKDSFEFLTSNARRGKGHSNWRDKFSQYSDRIDLEALTYIRGRSIANAFIVMDEAQNISKEEAKTILTRVGHGTKIVLTGDVEQIDSNKLDVENNGLSYIIEKFKNSELAGHITLTKGERSPLASLSAKIL